MIERVEMRTFKECLMCCGVEMVKRHGYLATNPPQYEYDCRHCKRYERSYKSYPLISYEEVGE
jgi:hypothetical protein